MRFFLRPLIAALEPRFDALRAREASASPAAGCLDDVALAALVDGQGSATERQHLAGCAHCRRQVAELQRVVSSGAVARELARLDPAPARWSRRGPLALAAAAVALVVVGQSLLTRSATDDRLRDHPAAEPGAAPALLTPRDEVSGTPVFRWRAVEGATEYRLTVFDPDGALVWQQQLPDTLVPMAADVELTHGTTYWWRVEARVDFDRWTASPLASFEPR